MVLAIILRKLNRSEAEAVQEVTAELFPHLEQVGEKYYLGEAVATVRSMYSTKRTSNITHANIAGKLGVTAEEFAYIGGWSVERTERKRKGRPETHAARLAHLKGIVAANGGLVPPAKDLVLALRDAGFTTSRQNVYRDLESLGLKSPGRRTKQPPNLF